MSKQARDGQSHTQPRPFSLVLHQLSQPYLPSSLFIIHQQHKMNNQQFRKLVLDTPARQSANSETPKTLGATPRRDGAMGPPAALGSRMRSSIPMTPYVHLNSPFPIKTSLTPNCQPLSRHLLLRFPPPTRRTPAIPHQSLHKPPALKKAPHSRAQGLEARRRLRRPHHPAHLRRRRRPSTADKELRGAVEAAAD
jgi:hypothetical protein